MIILTFLFCGLVLYTTQIIVKEFLALHARTRAEYSDLSRTTDFFPNYKHLKINTLDEMWLNRKNNSENC